MHQFLKFIFGIKFYMFRTAPLSIIRNFSLYTQQWYMSKRFADSLQLGSGRSFLILIASCNCKPVRHIPLLCVQWKTPDDGQKNCSKHIEFYSKNKFEKLVHLVGFIIRKFQGNSAEILRMFFYMANHSGYEFRPSSVLVFQSLEISRCLCHSYAQGWGPKLSLKLGILFYFKHGK